jgi:hypothetical protein
MLLLFLERIRRVLDPADSASSVGYRDLSELIFPLRFVSFFGQTVE